ncbi:MAG TPA: hypothetical protein VGX21_01455 [Methylomirabilota bacterium]|jgi:hypothetical protein|nr:hypothetical protein [Methylomirabilota bacterium]
MKLTMLLADAVQAVNGKLYVLGGGWSIIGPEPTPSAIAMKVEVPWDEANKKHRFRLALIDADGHPVTAPTSGGDRPVEIAGEFEAGRPAGLKAGSPLDVVVALNIGPLPLQADSRYVWRCWIDEQTREDWEVGFSTRAKGR